MGVGMYALILGCLAIAGGVLYCSVLNSGKMKQKIKEYQAKDKARGEIDEFSKKRRAKTVRDIDAPDKLEPWV